MFQNLIQTQLQRFKNFLGFAKYFAKKNLTPKILLDQVTAYMKDAFSLMKKKKMAKYRVDYQVYRLRQMEKLIAENNSHYFIAGKKINDIR